MALRSSPRCERRNADHVVKRRHTANLKRDLPGLVAETIEPLALHREAQAKTFERYNGALLTDQQVDHAIMRLYREGVIGVQRIADVSEQWEHPTHEEWGDHTARRLFNATTFALAGRIVENASVTPKLHQINGGPAQGRRGRLRPCQEHERALVSGRQRR